MSELTSKLSSAVIKAAAHAFKHTPFVFQNGSGHKICCSRSVFSFSFLGKTCGNNEKCIKVCVCMCVEDGGWGVRAVGWAGWQLSGSCSMLSLSQMRGETFRRVSHWNEEACVLLVTHFYIDIHNPCVYLRKYKKQLSMQFTHQKTNKIKCQSHRFLT